MLRTNTYIPTSVPASQINDGCPGSPVPTELVLSDDSEDDRDKLTAVQSKGTSNLKVRVQVSDSVQDTTACVTDFTYHYQRRPLTRTMAMAQIEVLDDYTESLLGDQTPALPEQTKEKRKRVVVPSDEEPDWTETEDGMELVDLRPELGARGPRVTSKES